MRKHFFLSTGRFAKPYFFEDDFTDAATTVLTSHVSNLGGTWSQDGGTPDIRINSAGDGAYQATSSPSIYYHSIVPSSANYYVEAVLVSLGAASADFGISGRHTASQNFYWCRWSSGNWQLYKSVANVNTQLGSNVAGTFPSNSSRTLRLTMNGATIAVSVDGTEVISVTDTAHAGAGSVGFRVASGSAATPTTGIHVSRMIGVLL